VYYERILNFRRMIKMLEMLMFAVIFTVVQVIGGFIVMGLMMSKPFMKMFIKKYTSLAKDLMEEMDELL
jgi:hypothetical protein